MLSVGRNLCVERLVGGIFLFFGCLVIIFEIQIKNLGKTSASILVSIGNTNRSSICWT